LKVRFLPRSLNPLFQRSFTANCVFVVKRLFPSCSAELIQVRCFTFEINDNEACAAL
jgi:hypothetical protein